VKRLCIISANLGGYDPPSEWAKQAAPEGWEVEINRLTDFDFPPRPLAMTSRLQAGIPKMFGWQMFPGADAYLWVDASRRLVRTDFAAWMLAQLGEAELAIFRHPQRASVAAEYEFVRGKMAAGNRYLNRRYAGEWLEEQMAAIRADRSFCDRALYASTSFIYRATPSVCAACRDWWHHKSRYLLHDQLALPYVLWRNEVKVVAIDADIYDLPYWEYVRG
jgi:hypothetical protein